MGTEVGSGKAEKTEVEKMRRWEGKTEVGSGKAEKTEVGKVRSWEDRRTKDKGARLEGGRIELESW